MKKYKGEHEKNYTVIIDESKWGEDELREFSEYFHDVSSPKDIVEQVIYSLSELGISRMVEGVGYIKVNGQYPFGVGEEQKCKSIEVIEEESFIFVN